MVLHTSVYQGKKVLPSFGIYFLLYFQVSLTLEHFINRFGDVKFWNFLLNVNLNLFLSGKKVEVMGCLHEVLRFRNFFNLITILCKSDFYGASPSINCFWFDYIFRWIYDLF